MPSSVEGQLVPGYLAPNSLFNRREVRQEIFPRYRENTLFNVIVHSNKTKETKQTTFNWGEDDWLYSIIEVGSVPASGGAGASIDITVAAASHQESGTLSPGKVNDLIMVGNIRGFISATNKATPNAHVYTVDPVNDADDIGAAAQTATKLTCFSNAHADGTGQPESMVTKALTFYNYTQIFKNQYLAYGSEAANKSEFSINGKMYYYLKHVDEAALKHQLDIDFALIFGEISNNLTDADGNTVYTTRGMDSFIRNFGTPDTYTTNYDFADLQADIKILNKERGPKKYWQLCGIDVLLDLENAMYGKVDQSGFDPSQFGYGSSKEKMVDFGIDGYRSGGYTFMKTGFDPLDYDPFSQSNAGKWSGVIYTIPYDRIKNPKAGQGGEDDFLDTICLRYKASDHENRFEKHWFRGIEVTNKDALEFNHRSELGLQFAMANATLAREAA